LSFGAAATAVYLRHLAVSPVSRPAASLDARAVSVVARVRRPLVRSPSTRRSGAMHFPRSKRVLAIVACSASLSSLPFATARPAAAATTSGRTGSQAVSLSVPPSTLLTLTKNQYVKVTRGITTYTIYISRVGRRSLYDRLKNYTNASTGALVAAASSACVKIGSVVIGAVCAVAAGLFGGYVVDKIVQSTRQAACLKIKGYNPAFPVGGPMQVFEFSVLPRTSKYCKTRY
jgi:hypothetical protein